MYRIFQAQIERIQTNVRLSRIRHKRYWASGIKCLLDSLGLSNFWNNSCMMYDVPLFSSSEIESVTISCNIGMLTFVTPRNWDIFAIQNRVKI